MLRAGIKPNDLNEVKKLGKPSDIIKLVFDLVGLLKMEKMVKTETAEITMGIGKEKRTFGFIKDSFKNMQGGMLADSSFLKNIFYFSKYEKDMINDETIEFMRVFSVLTWCGAFHVTRVHLTSMRVVSFSSLRPFGPNRDAPRRFLQPHGLQAHAPRVRLGQIWSKGGRVAAALREGANTLIGSFSWVLHDTF